MDTNQKINQWICDVFRHKNFKKIDVKVTGSSEKGDGYVGDIAFAEANIITSENTTKNLKLVIKYGKLNDKLRESLPVRLAFEREIYVYDKIVPQLRKFLEEKNEKLSFLPECYGTLLYDNQEVIILENLKSQNYDLHSRYRPLDISHLKLTLETYGKLHGVSFAYQNQHPEEARILFENLPDVMSAFLYSMGDYLDEVQEVFYMILQQNDNVELIDGIKKKIPNFKRNFKELLEIGDEKSVFVHGDCWNNNFMFKYCNSNNKSKPEAVKFLDFQMSNFRPPVFDLAYHIYVTASEKELKNFDNLLKIYHNSLSQTLKNLGSDPDVIYSYEDLQQQWKKFSSFGVMMAAGLPITLSSKEDTLNIEDLKENSQMMKIAKKTLLTNGEQLTARTIAFAKHYLEFC